MSPSHLQPDFFQCETNVLDMPDADVEYTSLVYLKEEADRLYKTLLKNTHWRQDRITVYGKAHLTPRLTCWIGDPWMDYSYSNHTMTAEPWNDVLLSIKEKVEQLSGESFNSVLLNYYRDGQDSNGWHSDDEPELGNEPIIASLSLGAARDFHMRHKKDKSLKRTMSLENGSLLLMRGQTQRFWQHHIPKRVNAEGRINLTFRTIVAKR